MEKLIAIVIDGVVYDVVESACKYLKNKHDVTITRDEWNTYRLEDLHLISDEDAVKMFSDYNLYLGNPMEGAIKSLAKFKKLGWTIQLLTSRNFEKLYTTTVDWLKDNSVPFDKLVFCDHNKGEYLSTYKVKFFVDDYPKFVKDAKDNYVDCVYLLDATYNRDYDNFSDGVIRVKDLSMVLNIVEEVYKLSNGKQKQSNG